jgi:hypothetical protein
MAVDFDACILANENNRLRATFAAQSQLARLNADDGAADPGLLAVGIAGSGCIGAIIVVVVGQRRPNRAYSEKSKEKHPYRIDSCSVATHISTPFGSIRLAKPERRINSINDCEAAASSIQHSANALS